ncbi:MAG TPA: DUF5939 domain-containing protein [Candidatus Obscuribacterales bacterium]
MTKPLPPTAPPTELEKLIAQAQRVRLSCELEHAPAVLWPHLSQTDQINQIIGLQPTHNRFEPNSQGGATMQVSTREIVFEQSYQEWPYEWQAPVWLRVDRVFNKGFLRYLGFHSKLEKTAGGGTRVSLELAYVPRLPNLIIKAVLKGKLEKLRQAYLEIDSRIRAENALAAEVFARDPQGHAAEIANLKQRWQALMPGSALPALLASFVYTAPDAFVRRMRPFEIAARHGLDPLTTLRFFLLAAKEGLLSMSWDLRCTSCQGAKVQTGQLQEVVDSAHCESCALDYLVRFDENLELTFAPAEAIRRTQDVQFCAGGPANTPHIVAQYNLEAGQTRELSLNLPPGDYRLRALSMRDTLCFRITAAASPRLLVLELSGAFNETAFESASPLRLRLHNPQAGLQTLKLENLNWDPHAVTAALVASLQEFRELFHQQQLPEGLQLPVADQVFCFAGLKQGSALFAQLGDEAAFSLLQEYLAALTGVIREAQGAVVKSMGDTLMAVFVNPADALAAALEAQSQLGGWNRLGLSPLPLQLQIGCARGPGIVTGSEGKTDYIGAAVNRAFRLQRSCPPGQIQLDQGMYVDPEVQAFLAQADFPVTAAEQADPQAEPQACSWLLDPGPVRQLV